MYIICIYVSITEQVIFRHVGGGESVCVWCIQLQSMGKKTMNLKEPREIYKGNFGVKIGKEEHNYSIISK